MSIASLPADIDPILHDGIRTLGLDADALTPPLRAYLGLLVKWNNTYNLTAIRDPREMVTKHLLDSLAMVAHVTGAPLADLGTGPGLPGIPIAIARPSCTVTLVESNGKKARFMREAIRVLKLPNARVAESRAEALDEPGAYSQITARALATLDKIILFGGHLLAPGGQLLAMKAETVAQEAGNLPPGWRLIEVRELQVPGLAATRQLAVVSRVS